MSRILSTEVLDQWDASAFVDRANDRVWSTHPQAILDLIAEVRQHRRLAVAVPPEGPLRALMAQHDQEPGTRSLCICGLAWPCSELTLLKHAVVERDDLLEALTDVVYQACAGDDGALDSMALSAYAAGIRLLAHHGVLDTVSDVGRRVIAVQAGTRRHAGEAAATDDEKHISIPKHAKEG